jgi:Zn-finger nucleic acid-binding protein
MAVCPRCPDAPLAERGLHGIEVAVCPVCRGCCVEQRRLIPLLTGLAQEYCEGIGLDAIVETIPDAGVAATCPRCAQTMDRFGYLGTQLVMLDRCGACAVLWLDPEELGTMTLLHARTQARGDAARQRSAQQQADMSRRLSRMMMTRAMNSRLGGLI